MESTLAHTIGFPTALFVHKPPLLENAQPPELQNHHCPTFPKLRKSRIKNPQHYLAHFPPWNSQQQHLKIDGWNTTNSFLLGQGLFSGAFAVSFREGLHLHQSETYRIKKKNTPPNHPDQTNEFLIKVTFHERHTESYYDTFYRCLACGRREMFFRLLEWMSLFF